MKIGASVSNNGCCLTVTNIKGNCIYFDVIKETLRVTNFSSLSIGDKINIERALKFGDEIGGHLVSGHVMTIAEIQNIVISKNNTKIYFKIFNLFFIKYIFEKGFITIDGISLTVNNVYKNIFSVYFIPETLSKTNISTKCIGDFVNIEVDYYTQIIIDQCERFCIKKY